MSIGVSFDEYWFGSPYIAMYKRKASHIEIQNHNQELWLQGLYFYDALGVCLANAFGGKNSKKQEYLSEPINILPKTGAELKKEQEEARQKAIDELTLWASNWSMKHGSTNS